MTRIALIGGHGKVALLAAPLLVAAGHTVDAIVRNPDHAEDVTATGARPIVTDVERLDQAGFADLLREHDVVIWSAGAGGGDPQRTRAVDRDAAIRSMEAAAAVGARRYVMVSYFGAGPDHGVSPDHPFHAYAEAKSAADAHLVSTDLDWTILRPSGLTDEPGTGTISVVDDESASVPRADVAAVIAAVVDDPATIGRTYAFNRGTVPVAEALTQ